MSVITKDLGVATAYGYAKSKGYTGTEEEFAELMASYADVAQQAEAAAQDAEDAKDEAVTAKTDAQTAKTAAQAAQSAAETASGTASTKASEAAQSAQTAAGSATAAGNSATAAAGSATTAQAAAQTATNKASEASSSASAASTAKTGAETARTGAQTAQTAAETAQANAEAAASSVSASAAQIEQNTEDIAELKNDLNEKADKTEALSAYIVETETGAIASFTDGADGVPVKDLTVAIEPVQDLHGQSNPYPPGGGNNILDPNIKFPTGTLYGLTLTSSDGYTFSYSGTANSSGNIRTNEISTADAVILPAGTYTTPTSSGTLSLFKANGSWLRNQYAGTFTVDEPFYVESLYFEIVSGRTYNISNFLALAKGSTAPTAWTPYSNICPITGWTGVKVINAERLAVLRPDAPQTYTEHDVEWDVTRYPFITAKGTASGGTSYSGLIGGRSQDGSLTAGTYTFKAVDNIDNAKIVVQVGSATVQNIDKDTPEITVTVSETTAFSWYCIVANGTTADASFAFVIGEANAYEIDLDGTVYGGTLDVSTGVLTVDKALWTKNTSTMDNDSNYPGWMNAGIAELIGSGLDVKKTNQLMNIGTVYGANTIIHPTTGNQTDTLYLPVSTYNKTQNEWKALAMDIQIAVELATPQTYQLTPQEVSTILGQNNVFADTGNVTVQYRADTKLYIDKVLSQA